MTRKKSNLCINRKKIKRFVQTKDLLVLAPSKVKSKEAVLSVKKPSSNKKRIRSVLSPYRYPSAKRLGVRTPKSSTKRKPYTSCLKTIPKASIVKPLFPIEKSVDDKNDFTPIDDSINESDNSEKCLTDLIPDVLAALRASNIDCSFLKDFFEEVRDGIFPLDNISFLLWIEVVKWYKQETTSTMRYTEATKKFWKLGWRHFGGKFVRYMTGFKNTSQLNSGHAQRGLLKPKESDINYAVPSLDILRHFSPYGTNGSERQPGTFIDAIKGVSNALHGTSACISFDGKKLKQGLTPTSGDVDLLGYEIGPTLHERQSELSHRLSVVRNLKAHLNNFNEKTTIRSLPCTVHALIRNIFLESIRAISTDAIKIREVEKKKEYALTKFMERGGENWRVGKFAFVVSAIKAYLYDIRKYLDAHIVELRNVSSIVAMINDSYYCENKQVNLQLLTNYRNIEQNTSADSCRKIQQRSQPWHEARQKAVVTGSTLYQAVGCDGLQKMKEHFDSHICKEKARTKSSTAQSAMSYGTDNEINATATFVSTVMPVIAPTCVFQEEGYVMKSITDSDFAVISPDGSLLNASNETISAVEFKCPVVASHKEVPHRYYLQCQATMFALGIWSMYYLCWRPDTSTVFQISWDEGTFSLAMDIVQETYCGSHKKRPGKLPANLPELKEKIESGRLKCTFIGEFPSVVASESVLNNANGGKALGDVTHTCDDLCRSIKDGYELLRQKATEAIVFLCSDLDRIYEKSSLRWTPINWFPKGYSLSTDVMRKIMENVLNECKKHGVHVPAISFDGQWHNISTRSVHNDPLTILQLIKDVWKEAEKKQKSELVKYFSALNKEVKSIKNESSIVCTNGGKDTPRLPREYKQQHRKAPAETEDVCKTSTQIGNAVPESVMEESISNLSDVHFDMALIRSASLPDNVAEEISNCNAADDVWTSLIGENSQASDVAEGSDIDNLDTCHTSFDNDRIILDAAHSSDTSHCIKIMDDLEILFNLLRTDPAANKKGQWEGKTVGDLRRILSDHKQLSRLLNNDLKVVVRFLKSRANKDANLKESDSKATKVEKICKVLGLQHDTNTESRGKRGRAISSPKKLSDISKAILNSHKVTKRQLNIAYAQHIWPTKYSEWKAHSPMVVESAINDNEDNPVWFSVPEFSETRSQLEVKSVDATHLFTRLRRHSIRGNIKGVSKDAWLKVAKDGKTFLSPIMVEELLDPMSVTMARTHFSETVEFEMRQNGYTSTANFVRDVREWRVANDDPGISAENRIKMRSHLRKRLMCRFDANNPKFPPASSYVDGIPIQLWEALLVDIEAKRQLYALARKGTYNVRAFSSMMGETFFAELTLHDSKGHGAVSSEDFGRFIGQAIEQMQGRLDNERYVR